MRSGRLEAGALTERVRAFANACGEDRELPLSVPGVSVDLHPGTFLAIVVASALAGTVAAVAGGRGLVLPVVVLELLLGILLGPWVVGLHVNELGGFFSGFR